MIFKNKYSKELTFYFLLLITFSFLFPKLFSKEKEKIHKFLNEFEKTYSRNDIKENKFASLNWQKIESNELNQQKIIWEKINHNEFKKNQEDIESLKNSKGNISKPIRIYHSIHSLNRSIIFDNNIAGPDISWIVPNGFKWNNRYKFDIHMRGHNTQIPEPKSRKFFGWNNGDAVGLISYQFLNKDKYSFGINLGIRSLYQSNKYVGGTTKFGEGVSSGFRLDYQLSDLSGIAFGAEQLVHFDDQTDTGRNIYLTTSKAWWGSRDKNFENFPLYIATGGIGTGRMAVGTVKGLCSNLFGGSGTEIHNRRNLCWSPIFSLASVWNENFSTFFEYNSRFFLFGNSIAPIENFPIRGTFALILSDHVDNYKIHDLSELNWVFNLSIGF